MAQASKLDLPSKPVEQEPWTTRRLFPLAAAAGAIKATAAIMGRLFTTPHEVMQGFCVFIMGLQALTGHKPSLLIYLTIVALGVARELDYRRKTKIEAVNVLDEKV